MATTLPAVVAASAGRQANMIAVAAKRAAFKNMPLIPLPALVDLVIEMDTLRESSLLLSAGAARDGMCVTLLSGVGKSTSAQMLVAKAASRVGKTVKDGPVLLIELDVDETISMWGAILRGLGDSYWNVGYPKDLKKRALKLLAKRGVELIIIDEFNHAADRGQARLMMNVIKEILNHGIAPVVVMGTDEEVALLQKSDAFERRMVHAPVIGPLIWDEGVHTRNWRGFLQGLDREISSPKILGRKSGLGNIDIAKALNETCEGVIGYAHWVVQDSLNEVLKRGGDIIETTDLAVSVSRLFVKHRIFERLNTVEAL